MNICLDLSAAIQQSAGTSRYESQLAKALLSLEDNDKYSYFFTNPQKIDPNTKLTPELAGLPNKSIVVANKVWRLKLLLWHLINFRNDSQVFVKELAEPRIFHGMDFIAPPLKAASVITVLDLSFLLYPNLHSLYNRWYLRLLLPLCVKKASRIVVISENTKRDLVNWLGPDTAERIRVTPLGVSDLSYFNDVPETELQEELSKYNLTRSSYILNVGTIEPRKNQVLLVEAFAQLLKQNLCPSTSLVLVGRKGWNEEYTRLKAVAAANGLTICENSAQTRPGQILILTDIDNKTLKYLYQGAAVTCYPSLYEGFGLPALEAMAAGSPLITSNNSSLPEVTGKDGEAAILVDPSDKTQLVRSLDLVLNSAELSKKLGNSGRLRARSFTWKQTAELTRQVYAEVYSEKYS